MAYQRQVFTRKCVFTIPNTAYPPSAIRLSAFRSKRRLFETPGLVESSSLKLDLLSEVEEHSEEETTEIMTE
ncbi:hypothetical protein Tco_0698882 [Tanacetum coccineum]